jgi:TonB-linked SusC/RagA family outer membrane protein
MKFFVENSIPDHYPGIKKICTIMKLALILTLFFAIQVNATIYSQNFSLKLNNVSLKDALKVMETKSDFRFFYSDDLLYLDKKVSLEATNLKVDEVLSSLLTNSKLTYKIFENKLIIITPNESLQQKKITGTITDGTTGEPLIGVNVTIEGTTVGTVTDANGMYSIDTPNANGVLVFSYIGYLTERITVTGQASLNVKLMPDVTKLDEVVVIGYGTMKKKDLTGSVSSLSDEKLLDRPAMNVAQAIGGKVAGVKIIERSGMPGGNAMIRVRGTNSINTNAGANDPLFVVDGVVGVENALGMLNPNEIQTIDVLKDASATAIYGARGANGVIIITTKRGIAGKTTVEYNGYVTRGVMNRHFYVLDAEQMMYVTKQAFMNVTKYSSSPNWGTTFDASIIPASRLAGATTYSEMPWLFEKTTPGGYSVPLLGKDGNYYKPRFDTNWENEIFRPYTASNHQINIRGGNERAKFGTFINYTDEDGLLMNTNFTRFSGKLNGDVTVNKWLDVSTNIAVNKNKQRLNDESFFSGGMARAAVEAYSILPIKYPNDPSIYGAYAGNWSSNADFPAGETPHNPVHISNDVQTYEDRTQVTGDITLNFKITSDLSFKSNFAVDLNYYKQNRYAGRLIDTGSEGSAYEKVENKKYWQNENYFNYNKTIGNHSITGMVGLSWSRNSWEDIEMSNSHYFDDFYGYHNIGVGTATRPGVGSWDGINSLNSYFARASYSFKNKYLFTATGRYDGSSRFGENSKYGFFPSASAAWRVSEEDFLKSNPTISNLKVRASIGQTGNQEIGSYVTQTFLGSQNIIMNGALTPGLFPNSVGNPDLKWEKTTQYDAGIDLGLFENRLMVNLDYYHKLTEDMLLDVPLPQSTTTGSVKMNYGTVENKGFEISINTHNIKSSNFNWYSDIAWSANKNTIIKLGPTHADILRNYWVGGANTILREGESIASFFGLNRLGTYSTQEASLAARYGFVPGDVKYEDKNGDGVISFVSDGGVLGSAFPKWDMNFANNIEFKNFDFNIDIRFSYGAKKENRTNHSSEDRQAMANGKNSILNAWRPDHQNTMIGQVRPGNGGAYYQTYPDTHWIEDCSFVRGDGMTLGYTLPKNILEKFGMSKVRFYATTKNFFLITKYTGYDPEGSDRDNMDGLTPGMDFFMYPRPTTYTLGVNIVF